MSQPAFPIVIRLAGEPRGKGRPIVARVKTKSGQEFLTARTPERTRNYEAALRYAASAAMGDCAPIEGPLAITVTAAMSIPASASKKVRAAMLAGEIMPTKKPDFRQPGKDSRRAERSRLVRRQAGRRLHDHQSLQRKARAPDRGPAGQAHCSAGEPHVKHPPKPSSRRIPAPRPGCDRCAARGIDAPLYTAKECDRALRACGSLSARGRVSLRSNIREIGSGPRDGHGDPRLLGSEAVGHWPFDPLPLFGFDVIMADPPWLFQLYGESGNANRLRASTTACRPPRSRLYRSISSQAGIAGCGSGRPSP